jgi:hypothetical protein
LREPPGRVHPRLKIRDAGVAKVTVCTRVARGYEQKFHFRVHVEAADRTDARNHDFYGW